MPDQNPYPENYFESRDRFRTLVQQKGWELCTCPIDAKGPNGEELSIDAGILNPSSARKCLIVSSGLHGAEGFFGAAVQLQSLQMNRTAPEQVRMVYLHALSPFAFAHSRRFNEDNVDPNRNFLLRNEAYAGSPPTYRQLDDLLNPQTAPNRWDCFKARIAFSCIRHGLGKVKQAVAGGQYDFPKGIFFGGHGPSQSTKIIAQHLPMWIGDAQEIVHLDFHSGLMPWGTYQLLLDPLVTPLQYQQLNSWYGNNSYKVSEPSGEVYFTRGGFGPWCVQQTPGRNYLYLCAEFGTYSILEVLSASREENQAFHYTAKGSVHQQRAQARMREAFCPTSEEWRRVVLQQSLDLIEKSIRGLTELG
jgi:hypothetical protein